MLKWWVCFARGLCEGAYCLWDEVEKRALESATKKPETVEAYKARLRSIALKLPKRVVTTAVEAIPKRAKAIVAANGGCIARD